jgi:hypothetical protein
MYHPYIRQKIFEARAKELERIAEADRAGRRSKAERKGAFKTLGGPVCSAPSSIRKLDW